MSVYETSRHEALVALRARILEAAREVLEGDTVMGELANAAGDQHLADHAADTLNREIDETLEGNALEIVGEIDAALARIEAGTYGLCASCGGPIPDERLDALPYATLCITCRRASEHA